MISRVMRASGLAGAGAALLLAGGATRAEPEAAGDRRVVKGGVVVEFSLTGASAPLREGDHAEVRFRITDVASGRPLSGVKPAAWLDVSGEVGAPRGDDRGCREKVGLYLKGSVGIRPLVDLNSYYLLVMNQDASVSVIDPVVSMTGNTSLYASIILKRPAEDWTRSLDDKRLFLTMPRAGEVAVVDTENFKVIRSVPAGERPVRIVRQNDGRYLWVGNDAGEASGVTVLDAAAHQRVGHVATGEGHHEIALAVDDGHAFVTNRESGTLSVIDVARLRKVKDLATGPMPISVAVSSLSHAAYVADGRVGTISVVDPSRLEVRSAIQAQPGLGPMRFTTDGRWGFAVNPGRRSVVVVDASVDRLVHEIDVGAQPYQVTMTRGFAYVRLLDSPQVKMINLLSLGEGRTPIVQAFAAGTGAPREAGEVAIADSVTQAARDAAVFVVNPADNTTSFYMEGMNAPMGSFGGYGHAVRAATVVDRSVKEIEPGIYTANVRIPVAGAYDVAFLLDNPRVIHCFHGEAHPDPTLRASMGRVRVEFVGLPPRAAGGDLPLRIRLTDPVTREPRSGLAGVSVLYHAVTGPKRQARARAAQDGMYEAELHLDLPGTYYLFVDVPSLSIKPNELPYRSVIVEAAPAPAPRNG